MDRTYVIAELGINHQGSKAVALDLIEKAAEAGADAVKFQKRTPELCVPLEEWNKPKATPWGDTLPYIEYRKRMEFKHEDFVEFQRAARRCGVDMAMSVWDLPSLEFENGLGCPWVKIPSAKLTDHELVSAAARAAVKRKARALVLSTGMSTEDEITEAMSAAILAMDDGSEHLTELWVMHCHSAYPAPVDELNLCYIQKLRAATMDVPSPLIRIGYSGHEYGRSPSEWAVALGAEIVERHITFDRNAPGSDHSASLEPWVFKRMVEHIRSVEKALGDGEKRVWDSELPVRVKLRGTNA